MYDTLISHPLVPANDIEVVLLGAQGSHITCKMSDLQGDFIFSELAYGTYQLYPDVAGVPVASVFITISEEDPVAGDFSLVITPFDVTYLGVDDPEPIASMVNIYPNPAKESVIVDFEMEKSGEVELLILDIMGRCLFIGSEGHVKGSNRIQVDISSLPSGLYQLMFKSEESLEFAGKIIISK